MKYIIKKIYFIIQAFSSMERGVSLFFAILIMSVILAIGAGISTILIQEIRMTGEMGHSVVAFYAADSGIEYQLYSFYKMPTSTYQALSNDNLINNSSYEVNAKCSSLTPNCYGELGFEVDENCTANNYCIKSIGSYEKTKRGIETQY